MCVFGASKLTCIKHDKCDTDCKLRLMEAYLAYYYRLSPHNIARENYVVIRYISLPLNRPAEQFTRICILSLSILNIERRPGSHKGGPDKSANVITHAVTPLCHKSKRQARDPRRNFSYVMSTCLFFFFLFAFRPNLEISSILQRL